MLSRRMIPPEKNAQTTDTTEKKTAKITAKPESRFLFFSVLPSPKFLAASTERPSAKPVMSVIKKLTTAVVEPIAARAVSPSTFPTIKASAQL